MSELNFPKGTLYEEAIARQSSETPRGRDWFDILKHFGGLKAEQAVPWSIHHRVFSWDFTKKQRNWNAFLAKSRAAKSINHYDRDGPGDIWAYTFEEEIYKQPDEEATRKGVVWFPSLETLVWEMGLEGTAEQCHYMIKHAPNLKTLKFIAHYMLDDSVLSEALRGMADDVPSNLQLESFEFSSCKDFSPEDPLKEIAKTLGDFLTASQPSRINVMGEPFGPTSFRTAVAGFPSRLQELQISVWYTDQTEISDRFRVLVETCPNIKILKILSMRRHGCDVIPPPGFYLLEPLLPLSNLEMLVFQDHLFLKLSKNDIRRMGAAWPRLTTLVLCTVIYASLAKDSGRLATPCTVLPTLSEAFPELTSLGTNLSFNYRIPYPTATPLRRWKGLKTLTLNLGDIPESKQQAMQGLFRNLLPVGDLNFRVPVPLEEKNPSPSTPSTSES